MTDTESIEPFQDPAFLAAEAQIRHAYEEESLSQPLLVNVQATVLRRLYGYIKRHPEANLDTVINTAVHNLLYDDGY